MTEGPARTALRAPSLALLPAFAAALQRGWMPDNVRLQAANQELLAHIARDPEGLIAAADRAGGGPPVTLADGSQAPRLPSVQRWIWDADDEGPEGFAGHTGVLVERFDKGPVYGHAPGLRFRIELATVG